jgi:short-subunit dehydrogenase
MGAPVPNRILITGASGGLGGALALHYAQPGRTLLLWGRDHKKLETIAVACRKAGAAAIPRSLDLSDGAAAVAALEQEDDAGAIGLALFVAGAGHVQASGDLVEDPAQVVRLGMVNFVTASAMAAALAGRMAQRRQGRIVLVGSASAFHTLPFAAAYAASKAGLAHFAQALRIGVKQYGVQVTLVSPGFVDTDAGRRVVGPRPFLLQPSDAAARIARAACRGKPHLIFPWPFALLRWIDLLLPAGIRDRLLLGLRPPSD